MIKSFRDKRAELIWSQIPTPRLSPEVQRTVLRKLFMLHGAKEMADLKVPPGNRLEKLRGDRAGQYSMRVNRQWRICFEWDGTDARNVEIADYH